VCIWLVNKTLWGGCKALFSGYRSLQNGAFSSLYKNCRTPPKSVSCDSEYDSGCDISSDILSVYFS